MMIHHNQVITVKSIITSQMMVEAGDKSMFLIDIKFVWLPLQNG